MKMETIKKGTENMLPFNVFKVEKMGFELRDIACIEYLNIEFKGPFIESMTFKSEYFTPHLWAQYRKLIEEFGGKLHALALLHQTQFEALKKPETED